MRQHSGSRRGALVLDLRTRRLFPFIERIYGDGGYQGPTAAAETGCLTIESAGRSATAAGFEVLPGARSSNAPLPGSAASRRLTRDFERYARTVAPSSALP